jgi:hypothetical protein
MMSMSVSVGFLSGVRRRDDRACKLYDLSSPMANIKKYVDEYILPDMRTRELR